MNAQFLLQIFPNVPYEFIININEYLGIKSSRYIMDKMYTLIYQKSNIQEWQQLINDSKDVKINMQFPVYCSKNLAVYLQIFITEGQLSPECIKSMERFCIQAIKNNPKIIYNEYELIPKKGPMRKYALPSFDLMIRYLINRSVDNKEIPTCIQKESMIFNILSFILVNRYVNKQNLPKIFNALEPGELFTSKTLETLDIILGYGQYPKHGQGVENLKQHIPPPRIQINEEFLADLFLKFDSSLSYYGKQYNQQYREKKKQQYMKETISNAAVFKQIIQLLDTKHNQYIYDNSFIISNIITKNTNPKFLQFLLTYKHFREIILWPRCIFDIFRKRNSQLIKMIWSQEEQRYRISKMRVQDKNLLEYVCQSYGLTHNIICLLWDSGLFQKIPPIRNMKSREKIFKKYQLT